MIDSLCPPAILYLGFSLTQIIIDTFKGHNNTAFFKTIVMIVFTLLLNILCKSGLSLVSWLIVFIPFILMTYITAVLLFVFGLSPSSSENKYSVQYPDDYPEELLVVRQPHEEIVVDFDKIHQ
jgi:energy-coupling factor transporter transmembrane protein EcfT